MFKNSFQFICEIVDVSFYLKKFIKYILITIFPSSSPLLLHLPKFSTNSALLFSEPISDINCSIKTCIWV